MSLKFASVIGLALAAVLLGIGASSPGSGAASTRVGFGFNATLSGFPGASAFLSGGGSFDPTSATNTPGADTTVHSGGGFSCLSDISVGGLSGCLSGEGVRWDTAQLLASTTFKCNGAADTPHTVSTGSDTVVLLADFYRAGDGINESFTEKMFVSNTDQRPDLPGDQKVWIAGVGCSSGDVHVSFSH